MTLRKGSMVQASTPHLGGNVDLEYKGSTCKAHDDQSRSFVTGLVLNSFGRRVLG